jgi:hypothetical protein
MRGSGNDWTTWGSRLDGRQLSGAFTLPTLPEYCAEVGARGRLARDRLRFPTTVSPAGAAPSSSASTSLGPSIDALEAVKFICKDVWIALYDKQIDNLRTNHRGVYVLLDSSFKPLSRVSGAADDENVARRTKFVSITAGGVGGVLTSEYSSWRTQQASFEVHSRR